MLVGRQRELEMLVRCLDDCRRSGCISTLVSGESGIGKTSLLASVRETAKRQGFEVASVVSHEGIWTPPYTTWTSVLEQLTLPPLPAAAIEPGAISAEEHRFALHRAVIESIRTAAAIQPIVVVLDDLQWMDQPSRDLLFQLITQLGDASVMVLGAWRSPVSERDQLFASFLATLRRDPAVRWLELRGLDESDVAMMVSEIGWTAGVPAVRQLTAETNGNPFFVAEVARFLQSATSDSEPVSDLLSHGVPPSIRDVVRLRFNGLSERTRQMLSVAAIFSNGFEFALLRGMTDLEENDLLDAIDDAIDTNFLKPTDLQPEHYDFAHAIVREALAATWSSSRRARLHRRAAEAFERLYAGRTHLVSNDLAVQFFASRSIEGAERGVVYALASAEHASRAFDHGLAANLLGVARELAITESLAIRADIEWRLALAQAESLQIGDASQSAERAVEMLRDADSSPDIIATVCWKLAHTLNAVGAPAAIRNRLQQRGLQAIGNRRDMYWARLRLLGDPIETIPGDLLFAACWIGYDPEAQLIARASDSEEDQVQTIESFDARTPDQTRELILRARSWLNARATLRGLTVAANDLMYRHGAFRHSLAIWNDVLTIAKRIGAIPWQANALNQITLLHITLGEFDLAVASKHAVEASNAMLGPANDAEALLMERDFALTHYLDGDWPNQASYWLHFVGNPPQGLEAQLAVPLYAAMAASAAATAGIGTPRALSLVDALASIATCPGVQQVNGVVAWAADALVKLGSTKHAHAFDRLAVDLIDAGIGDYPQTSLHLTRARMLTLLGDPHAQRQFELARETLALQGQTPLLGITCYEQALIPSTSSESRKILLQQALGIFEKLGMTTWHERASTATRFAAPVEIDRSGVTRRELEVLRLVARGYSDRRIADELFVSDRTVNAHVRNMLQKTEVTNRTELTLWGRSRGLIDQ